MIHKPLPKIIPIAAAAFGFIFFLLALIFIITDRGKGAVDQYEQARVRINGYSVFVQVPYTDKLKQQGLAGRTSLAENRGMLWRYNFPATPSFWMKGMLIPLDFIWISHGRVVDLTTNVLAPAGNNTLPTFRPKVPVTEVLEVPAGFINRHRVTIGVKVTIFAN